LTFPCLLNKPSRNRASPIMIKRRYRIIENDPRIIFVELRLSEKIG